MRLVAVQSRPIRPDLPRQFIELLGKSAQLTGARDLHFRRTLAGGQLFESAGKVGELFEDPVGDQHYRKHRRRDDESRGGDDHHQQMPSLVCDQRRRHAD